MITDIVVQASIVKELLRWPVFLREDVRQDLVAGLSFRDAIAIGRTARDHVFHIVSACCLQPCGFAALFAQVRLHDPGQNMDALFTLLEEQTRVPVKWRERMELKNILRHVRAEPALLAQAWELATRKQSLPANPEGLLHYLDFLAEDRAHADDAPLFFFLEYLRPHLGNPPALAPWEDAVARRLKLNLPSIQAAAQAARQQHSTAGAHPAATTPASITSPGSAVLTLMVQPLPLPGEYLVRGWLYQDGSCDQLKPARDEDEDENSPEVSARTCEAKLDQKAARFIQSALGKLRRNAALRIEVILPCALLDHAIDEWKIPITDTDSDAIGVRWPVMLRSWDRMAKTKYVVAKNLWRDKWPRLETEWKRAQSRFWWQPGAGAPSDLRIEMERDTLVFLAARLHDDGATPSSTPLLNAVLGAGVPVALWLRGYKGEASRRHDDLHALLEAESHHAFPDDILSRRRSPRPPPEPADRFALFWDCPDRIPEPCQPKDDQPGVRPLQSPTAPPP